MTRDAWLATHPYLRDVAEFQERVEQAASLVAISSVTLPNWGDYSADFLAGMPLLHSSSYTFDVESAGKTVVSLIKDLSSKHIPENLAVEIRDLESELSCDPVGPRQATLWLLDQGTTTLAHLGLLRYIGWAALRRYLHPLLEAFRNWRREDNWLRPYCPTCGCYPAMAQLVGAEASRMRYLYCGNCGTSWRYQRTGCPFCEYEDEHRLKSMTIEGEGGLRIDFCESCGRYLKTYDGVGNESLLLADWTSLHLDVLARDRGLNRSVGSLFEV